MEKGSAGPTRRTSKTNNMTRPTGGCPINMSVLPVNSGGILSLARSRKHVDIRIILERFREAAITVGI
jgi:hypothetical protein